MSKGPRQGLSYVYRFAKLDNSENNVLFLPVLAVVRNSNPQMTILQKRPSNHAATKCFVWPKHEVLLNTSRLHLLQFKLRNNSEHRLQIHNCTRFSEMRFILICLFLSYNRGCPGSLSASLPVLKPPICNQISQLDGYCSNPSTLQLSVLYLSLGLLTIGGGGVRPCSLLFGIDQFDKNDEQNRKSLNSYYNNFSWAIGFGMPRYCCSHLWHRYCCTMAQVLLYRCFQLLFSSTSRTTSVGQ
jgi:hypothetical protein